MGGSQVAVVMILGGLLLIYGGATGRLGDAWHALSGGSKPAEEAPAGDPKDKPESDEAATKPDNSARGLAMVSAQAINGQMVTRGGGFR